MIQIRPVSDLRNKFPESELTDDLELKLDEADSEAAVSDVRYAHDEVFSRLKAGLNK